MRGQRRPVFGNALLTREPQQGTLGVALVVLQGLGGEASRHVVQVRKIGPNRAVAGRDHLHRLIQRLGDLPQGGRPVPPGLLRQLRARRR